MGVGPEQRLRTIAGRILLQRSLKAWALPSAGGCMQSHPCLSCNREHGCWSVSAVPYVMGLCRQCRDNDLP